MGQEDVKYDETCLRQTGALKTSNGMNKSEAQHALSSTTNLPPPHPGQCVGKAFPNLYFPLLLPETILDLQKLLFENVYSLKLGWAAASAAGVWVVNSHPTALANATAPAHCSFGQTLFALEIQNLRQKWEKGLKKQKMNIVGAVSLAKTSANSLLTYYFW